MDELNISFADQQPQADGLDINFLDKPRMKYAKGFGEALTAGYQGSATGLAIRGKLPEIQLDPSNSKWYERLAASGAQMASEAPLMIAGAIGGGAAGSAVPVVGTVVGSGAGAFALPAAIRESYIQAYQKGEITSSADFLNRAAIVLKQTGKEAFVGGLTAGVGKAAGVAAETMNLGAKATMATTLAAEGTTLVVTPALLEGRLPEPQDFTDAAILLVGLKGTHVAANKLMSVYQKTGKTPIEVMADAKSDPTIIEDLKAPTYTPRIEGETVWQHQGSAMPGLANRPMWFSKEGDNFHSIGNTTENGLPLNGTLTGHLSFEKPLVESQVTQEAWNSLMAKAKDAGATDADINTITKDWLKRGEFSTSMPDWLLSALKAEGYDGVIADTSFKSPHAIALNPSKSLKVVNDGGLFNQNDIPRAYQELAKQENARNAVPDPSPEAKQFLDKPFADVPQLPGEPVLSTHVNYNYLNTSEDVMGAMSRMSQLYEAEIKTATRGEVPWEQTYAEARQMFERTTGEKAPELALGNNDYAKLSADLYARKQILISGAEQLMVARDAYAEAKANGLSTDQMKLELLAQIDRVAQAQASVRGAQAEVGRALNILKSTNRDKAYFDELTGLIDGRFGVEGKLGDANFETMVEMMGQLGSPTEALKFAEKASKATTWQKVVEAWKAGLVSGPFTQIANILGNTTFMATRPLVDTVAVATGKLRGTPDRLAAVEPLARIMGNIHGAADGARVALAVMKTGETTSTKAEAHRKAIEGSLGEVIRTPFRLLSAADAFFRVSNERGEAWALAAREATKEGYNPATREFRERVIEIAQNPTDKMQAQIEDAGQRFTFNMPLGEKGRAIQSTITKLHLEWAVPFIQTPANVAKEMMRLTPAAPIVKEWRDAIAKGGPAADKAIAEMVVGTTVGTAVFAMALSGNISGQGDPDPRKRATQLASGWQPYSVKVGDTWYSYQRLQPVGTLIGMAADAATVWDHMNPDESDKIPKILSTAFANAITNQTFLQGITNLINAISDPDRNGSRFIQNFVGSAIPALVGQTAQMLDPYQREVNSVLDAIQARLPGLSQDLMPKRDPYGEPIPGKDRVLGISPVTTSKVSDDKVRTEAARLGIGVAKAPDYIELPAGRDKKLGKVELTPEQKDVFADKAGHMAHQILTQVVNSPSWDNTPDMVQRATMDKVFEMSRKVGKAAAVPPEQIQKEAQRIAAELQRRLATKPLPE